MFPVPVIRSLAARIIASCLFIAPLPSLANETGPLAGVWRGMIGKQHVTACFNGNGGRYSGHYGSYYYRRHLSPISLIWRETGPDGSQVWDEGAGKWRLDDIAAGVIRGTWTSSDDARSLPVELEKVKESDGEPVSGWCASDAYNEALEASVIISRGPIRDAGGVKYRELRIDLGEQKYIASDAGLHMATVELMGDSTEIMTINSFLRSLISEQELFECRRAQLGATGGDGHRAQMLGRVFVNRNRLTVRILSQGYCATAHPSVWETEWTWNLTTGEEEHLLSWFKGGTSVFPDTRGRGSSYDVLPAPLAEFIASRFGQGNLKFHMSKDELRHCYGDDHSSYSYRLSLTDKGIDFELPITRNGSCGEKFELTFKELAPFLNKKGRNAVADFLNTPK
jgi:hypothetical protein